jgi:hypothetical protein
LTSRFAGPDAQLTLNAKTLEHINGLPADSPGWAVPVDGHVPIVTYAHIAAMYGLLPEGFDKWDLMSSEGETVAHYAVHAGYIPKGFKHWALKDGDGFAVANYAACKKTLPVDFDQWDICDEDGFSIAHQAAASGILPPDAPMHVWAIRNNEGWTAAHSAAQTGRLPTDVPDEVLGLQRMVGGSTGISVASTVMFLNEDKSVQYDPRLVERARAIHDALLREQAAGEAKEGCGPESDVPDAAAPGKDSSAPRKSKRTSSSAGRRVKKV